MDNAVDTTERTSAPRRNRQKSTNPAVDADTILPELEQKLSAAKARQTEISTERRSIALAAHMGSAEDRARLDELNQESAILAGEIEGIETAVAQAKARIADAQAEAAAEVERNKRREVVKLGDEIRAHGQRIDDLWRQSLAEYGHLEAKLAEIVQRGVGPPSLHVVRITSQRALIATFIGSPLQIQMIAPNERHTMAYLVNSWADGAETWAGKDAT
jgi:hypothetical protein